MTPAWTWRAAEARDRPDQLRLFNECFRKQKDQRTLAWKYDDNPHGRALGVVATNARDQVVGAYAYVPRRFRCDGRSVLLMQASDAMVDASARRQGIFTGLDDVVADLAGQQGVPWAFAYSGRLSLQGFLGNGWEQMGEAPVLRYRFRSGRGLQRLGRLGPLVARGAPLLDAWYARRDRRRLRGAQGQVPRLTRLQRFDEAAEELFEACAPATGWIGERDAAWLNWRYVDTPTARHECFALWGREGGRMDGYLVAEFVDGNAYLVDHLARDDAARDVLLGAFTSMAHARGMEEATALLFDHHPAVSPLLQLGWAKPLHRLLFRDMFPFIVRACRSDVQPASVAMGRWALADGDRDAEHMSPESAPGTMKHRLKLFLRRLVSKAFHHLGLRAFFRGSREGVPVLMFHNVGSPPETDYLPDHMKISEAKLDRLLRLLKRAGYRTRTVSQVAEDLSAEPLPTDTVALTFDDGYRDNHDILLPLLQQRDATATVFVQTGPMKGKLNWLHHYFWVLHRVGPHKLGELLAAQLEKAHLKSDLTNLPVDDVAAEYEMKRLLKYDVTPEDRDRILARIFADQGGSDSELARSVYMGPDDCRALDRAGVEIGAHTVNHLILSSLDTTRQRLEIEGSLRDLEAWLGHGIPTFAYPYGRAWDYNEDTLSILKELGFATAITAMPGLNDASTPRLELGRIAVNQDSDLAEIMCEVDGVFDWFERRGISLRT